MQLKVLLFGFLVFGVKCGVSFAQLSMTCPSAEFIAPCVCYIPNYYLVCEGIQDVEKLRQVAVNLEGVRIEFTKFWISNSSLQYLPSELLEIVRVKELHIENVTLQSLFRDTPASLTKFEIIRLHNVKLLRGVVWKVFSQMSNLKTITIDGISVPIIKTDFNQYVPHHLQQIEFLNTRTKKFEIGVFEGFENLERLEMYKCRLEELHRGNFPVPFNVKDFYFPLNRLKSIPADLFTDMPNLNDVILFGNQLSTIPESAFGGNFNQIERLLLADNPLKCNCDMRWIVRKKPQFLDGTCVSPKVMHGKELNNLYYDSFYCGDDSAWR